MNFLKELIIYKILLIYLGSVIDIVDEFSFVNEQERDGESLQSKYEISSVGILSNWLG